MMSAMAGEGVPQQEPPIGSSKMWIWIIALVVFFMIAVIIAAIVAAS